MHDPGTARHAAAEAREHIESALADPPLRDVAQYVARLDRADVLSLPTGSDVRAELGGAITRIAELKALLAAKGALTDDVAVERLALLRAARNAVPKVTALPVDPWVQRQFYDAFHVYAAPTARQRPLLAVDTPSFIAAGQLVGLVRFPAGQYHWDMSGLSRRYLLQVPPRDLPSTLFFLARRLRAFAPAFFPHVNAFRRNPFVWLEAESNRSFHRMARALLLQPHVVGLVTRAWLHDPGIGTVSPHLAWINRVFRENGGIVVSNGDASHDPDVLTNNAARKRAVEQGDYRPRYGLVVWPRAAMLDWARRHPEFAD